MSAPRGSHSKLGQGSISGGGATTPQNTFCFTTKKTKHYKGAIHIVIVKAREKHKDKDKWEIHNALNFVPSCTYLHVYILFLCEPEPINLD